MDVSTAISNINEKKQVQTSLSITTFPFGNLNFYTQSTFLNYTQDKINHFVYAQLIGFKLANRIWVESTFTIGELKNYNENNASLVYNIPDKITFKSGLLIILPLKLFDLTIRYQYFKRESSYFTYINSTDYITSKTNYQNHQLTGGIKWNF